MDESKLEQELREKLPPDEIWVDVERGLVGYYDWYGVTFRKNPEEAKYADGYILRIAEEKVGFPVEITEWGPSNNGHFAHHFKPKQEYE